MASESFWSSTREETLKSFHALFDSEWPPWLAGILIAIIALMIFLWQAPWGIAAGYRDWGDWVFHLLGVSAERPLAPWLHPVSLSNVGILVGAFTSALMARQFKIRRAPRLEYGKGIVGGILMGFGASMAKGCNVGGFYTAVAMFSGGGFAMMFGLGAGAWVGLKYLLWEMEHLPSRPVTAKPRKAKGEGQGIDWNRVQPRIGFAVMTAVIAVFYLYGAIDKTQLGGWLFFGFLIGLVMHRSRFCFVRAFRCPFMTGEADMVKAVSLSLMIYISGSAVIKWSYLQEPAMGIYHSFFMGSLIGGFVFGVGMLLAGGCASSTLWRVGEGQTKLMFTLVSFSISDTFADLVFHFFGISKWLGKDIFLPDILSWPLTMPLVTAFFLLWVVAAVWNEKTEKFVVF